MATSLKNLSDYDIQSVPDAKGWKFAVVQAEWNEHITGALANGAIETLKKHGVNEEDILKKFVPGTFELTHASRSIAEYTEVDAVIAIGVVIRGDTPHFDYICQGVTQGLTELNVAFPIPFIFGVLTTENEQQALYRAGGIHGNKGDEAAITAIKMVQLNKQLEENV